MINFKANIIVDGLSNTSNNSGRYKKDVMPIISRVLGTLYFIYLFFYFILFLVYSIFKLSYELVNESIINYE